MRKVYELETELKAARDSLKEKYGVKDLDATPDRIYLNTEHAHCGYWSHDEEPKFTLMCSRDVEPTVEAMQRTVEEFEADKKRILKVIEEWENDLRL